MKEFIIKSLATFFGIGYLPLCPGTWASIAAAGLFLFLAYGPLRFSFGVLLVAAVSLLVIGVAVSDLAEKIFKKKDSPYIVIDEVAAMVTVLVFVPQNPIAFVAAFLIFRMFDIIKPYPAKKIEQFSGSWGIMGDDFIAGLYTVVCIWLFSLAVRR